MKTVTFQQDSALPHYSDKTLECLDNYFPEWLKSQWTNFQWSLYSPALNPQDFFLWSYLKEQIYADQPKTLQLLKENISYKMKQIPANMIEKIIMMVNIRIAAVILQQGR